MAIARKSKATVPGSGPAPLEAATPEALSDAVITAAIAPFDEAAQAAESAHALAAAPAATMAPAATEAVKAAEAAGVDFQQLLKQNADKAIAEAKAAQERVRQAAEQSLEQTRAAYEKLKSAAEEATASLESSYAAAARGWSEMNQKAIGAIKDHADAHFEHVKAVIAARSMPEMIELQTAHVKARIEAANEQMKELANVAKKVATEAGEPIKAVLTKRFAA